MLLKYEQAYERLSDDFFLCFFPLGNKLKAQKLNWKVKLLSLTCQIKQKDFIYLFIVIIPNRGGLMSLLALHCLSSVYNLI